MAKPPLPTGDKEANPWNPDPTGMVVEDEKDAETYYPDGGWEAWRTVMVGLTFGLRRTGLGHGAECPNLNRPGSMDFDSFVHGVRYRLVNTKRLALIRLPFL